MSRRVSQGTEHHRVREVRVVHQAQVIGLLVDVVAAPVPQAQVVPQLVHEGAPFQALVGNKSVVGNPQRHDEVIAGDLRRSRWIRLARGRRRHQPVTPDCIVKDRLLGRQQLATGRLRQGALRVGAEVLRLQLVKIQLVRPRLRRGRRERQALRPQRRRDVGRRVAAVGRGVGARDVVVQER